MELRVRVPSAAGNLFNLKQGASFVGDERGAQSATRPALELHEEETAEAEDDDRTNDTAGDLGGLPCGAGGWEAIDRSKPESGPGSGR